MIEVIFLIVLAVIWIGFATIQDFKSREVANWLNFSLVIFALAFRFFYSLFSEAGQGFSFFYQGVIGFAIFFAVGNIFYYSRIFAGGDAKLMIALGAVLPFYNSFFENIKIFGLFIFLFLFSGALYGVFSSIILSIKNFKQFKREFFSQLKHKKNLLFIFMIFGVAVTVAGFFESIFFYFGALIFLLPFFYAYTKAVDESCMIKNIAVKDLTEGDWLYKNLKMGRKTIKAKWEGLSEKDIKEIRKRYKSIKIKQGIPFTPAFLLGFVFLVVFYFLKIDLWNALW